MAEEETIATRLVDTSVTGECKLSVACNEQACISLLYTLSDVLYLLVLHEHVHHRLLEPLKVGVVGKCCFEQLGAWR